MNEEKIPVCLSCGNTSDQAVLLACVKQGEDAWVCVHCLPMLIHGAH